MKGWRVLVTGLAMALLQIGTVAQARDTGATEYAQHCASCHGETGRGDGYLASTLVVAPPDLTSIARRNNGAFPVSDVRQIIVSGRRAASVHVTGQMPVWGAHYSLELSQSLGVLPLDEGPGSEKDAAAAIDARVNALVSHVMALQAPAPDKAGMPFEYFLSQIVDVLKIAPADLEIVVIPPKGYGTLAVDLSVDLKRDGKTVPGSGSYELRLLAKRDLAGGQTQYSFGPSDDQIEGLSGIFGSAELIGDVEDAIARLEEGLEPAQPRNALTFGFESSFCTQAGQVTAGSPSFPQIHIRDRSTGAKFAEVTMPIDAHQFSIGACP